MQKSKFSLNVDQSTLLSAEDGIPKLLSSKTSAKVQEITSPNKEIAGEEIGLKNPSKTQCRSESSI